MKHFLRIMPTLAVVVAAGLFLLRPVTNAASGKADTPVLYITKTGPREVYAGQPITYTLTVTNSGTLTVTHLLITDAIPADAHYVPGSGTVIWPGQGTTALSGSAVISWTVDRLPPDAHIAVGFVVTATHTITNVHYRVTAEGGVSATGSAAVQTIVPPRAVYLPLVMRNYAPPLQYNESLGYNLIQINAPQAWTVSAGDGVIVAIIDTGVDLDHPDLQANVIGGASFVGYTTSPDDDRGHGSHVAGIAAGAANNGGVIGVAPRARIMPVKVLDWSGSGYLFDVVSGVEWAADNGAQVINLSLGTVSDAQSMRDAVDYAVGKGALVVSSAGNCGGSNYADNGCDYQDQPNYPAAYDNVLAVASTTQFDAQSSFSNQGSYVDIAAPGSFIYSAYYYGLYTWMSGTSMAAPHVSGLAALLWFRRPDYSNEEVRAQILNSAVDLGAPGWDIQFGYGRIDAAAALGAPVVNLARTSRPRAGAPIPFVHGASYAPGEVLVKLNPRARVSQILGRAAIGVAGVRLLDSVPQLHLYRLTAPAGEEEAIIAALRATAGVAYAEPNYRVTAH